MDELDVWNAYERMKTYLENRVKRIEPEVIVMLEKDYKCFSERKLINEYQDIQRVLRGSK